jgi:hypothetical protein
MHAPNVFESIEKTLSLKLIGDLRRFPAVDRGQSHEQVYIDRGIEKMH